MLLRNIAFGVAAILLASGVALAVDKVFRDAVVLQYTLRVDGATTLNGNATLGNAATDTVTVTGTVQGASPLVFEGTTADAYETTLSITDPTADRTITLPNATGTVLTTGTFSSITEVGVLTGASPLVFEGATSDEFETTLAVTDPGADYTLTLPAATGTLMCTGADVTFLATLSGGADISVATSAAGAAGSTLDLVSGAGGAASTDSDGQTGGALTLTGGAGTVLNGAGTNDGAGGDVVLLGGAKGGATGTAVDGIVRVGSPTVGSTKTTNLLAVGGGFEVDGASVFDGNVTIGDAATDTVTVTGTVQGVSPLVFEGTTSDDFETTLTITDPTADRTITLPNATGTVLTTGTFSSITEVGVLTGASPLVFEGTTADEFETTLTVTDPGADYTLTLPAATGTLLCTGADVTFAADLSGGADISVAAAAAGAAGATLDLVSGAGGTASTDADGQAGGALTLTGGAGTVLNGAGTNDGAGGDVVLLGGAKGGATGTAVDGIVRIGSPTVGSTKTTNLLAVGGGFEVDGASRFDGTVAFNSTTTFQTGDVTSSEIADVTRSIPLPLHAWVPCADGVWDSAGADAEPDLAAVNTALVIEYDATGGSIDTGEICTSFTVPADWASGGSFVARATQGGATVTQTETFSCRISVDGAAISADAAANLVNQTAAQSVTVTPTGTWAAGASIGVACKQGNASADDTVNLHAIEARYTAVQ